jgi:uncharacterized protein YxjI
MPSSPFVQRINSLIHGVSRQADSIRFPGQVQEAKNLAFNVIDGARKRPGSTVVNYLSSGISAGLKYRLHKIERDNITEFLVIYTNGGIVSIYDVFNDQFNSVSNQTGSYLSAGGAESGDYRFQNIADATFIVNTKRTTRVKDVYGTDGDEIDSTRMPVKLARTNSSPPFTWAIKYSSYTPRTFQEQCLVPGAWNGTSAKTWRLKCKWTGEWSAWIQGNASSTDVQEALQGNGKSPEDYDDAIVGMKAFPYGKIICTGGPIDHKRMFVRISPDIEANKILQFGKASGYGSIALAIGRGHDDQNPAPQFIRDALPITDIGYYNNRMVLASDEYVVFSASDDLFNYYLDDSAFIVDSDPIEAQLAATDITLVDYVVPFRQSVLIMTRAGQQFELSTQGEPLTPSTTSVTASTRYETQQVRPVAIGDRLYFPGGGQRYSVIYEYFYDDMAVSNKAADVTRHVHNYVPPVIVNMVACTNTETLYVMPTLEGDVSGSTFTSDGGGSPSAYAQWSASSTWTVDGSPRSYDNAIIATGDYVEFDDYAADASSARSSIVDYQAAKLYVYQSYTQGQERKQSAWGQWDFDTDAFMDAALIDTDLYLLRKETHTVGVVSTTRLFVDKIDTSGSEPKDAGEYTTHLDHRVTAERTGTKTFTDPTWTVEWDLSDAVGASYADTNIDTAVNPTTSKHVTVTMASNGFDASATFAIEADATEWALAKPIFGRAFTAELTLSKVFMRDNDGKAVVDGRTAIKKLIAEHRDAGSYDLSVTDSQDTSTTRLVTFAAAEGKIDTYGEQAFWAHGNAENLTFKLTSTDPRPCIWTSLEYHGEHTTTTE